MMFDLERGDWVPGIGLDVIEHLCLALEIPIDLTIPESTDSSRAYQVSWIGTKSRGAQVS